MNIEVVSHSYPTDLIPFNGTFVRDHIHAIGEDHDVSLALLNPLAIPGTSKSKNSNSEPQYSNTRIVNYLSIPRKSFSGITLKNLQQKFSQGLDNSTQLYHLQFCYPAGMLAAWLKRKGKPSVLTVHGDDFYSSIRKNKLKTILRDSFEAVHKIIPVGKGLGDDIASLFPEVADKIQVIHNFFREDIFKETGKQDKVEAKKHLSFSTDQKHILTVANMRHKKGIDVLIHAINRAFNSPDYQFHIVGRLYDDAYEGSVRTLIQQYNLTNVTLHGPKDHGELPVYYQAADAFVLPSRNEPFGISVLEALSAGLPVVSTLSGGPAEIITDKIGALSEVEDVDGLIESMSKVIDSLSSYNAVGLRQDAIERFGINRYRMAYNQLYSEAVNL